MRKERMNSMTAFVYHRCYVVHLPGSGHWPFLDDPVGVEQALIPFLRRVWRREP